MRKLNLHEFKPLEKLIYCSGLSLSDFKANTFLYGTLRRTTAFNFVYGEHPKLVNRHK